MTDKSNAFPTDKKQESSRSLRNDFSYIFRPHKSSFELWRRRCALVDDTYKRIYLDTSHLNLLSDWLRDAPAEFAQFRSRWEIARCALVVTQVHQFETRRHGGATFREHRLELYRQLLPVITDLPQLEQNAAGPTLLVHRELFRVLHNMGLISINEQRQIDRCCSIFLGCIETAEEVSRLAVLDDPAFDLAMKLVTSALKTSAKARTRELGPYLRTRFDTLPDCPPPTGHLELMREALQNPDIYEAEWKDLLGELPEEVIGNMRRGVMDMTREIIELLSQVGPRQFLLKQFDLTSDKKTGQQYTDDLVQNFLFKDSIRELLHTYTGADESTTEWLSGEIPMSSCPGTYVRNIVAVEMRLNKALAEPGDELDLDHLAFLPYVSLFTADKRVVRCVEHALAPHRGEVPKYIKDLPRPIRASDRTALLNCLEPFLRTPECESAG